MTMTMSTTDAKDRNRQRTIRRAVSLAGRGYLSGVAVSIEFRPAPVDSGITFVRTDLPGELAIPATIEHVVPRQRRTAIARGDAVVEMVEHVMAALAGLGVDNCTVAIDAPETPGCDGSSQAFVEAIRSAGILVQDAPARILQCTTAIRLTEGEMAIAIEPANASTFEIDYELNYPNAPAIGRQRRCFVLQPDSFETELASARTFVLEHEAEMLKAAGIGRHCTTQDLLIFGADGPIENALRYPDEPVRHKMLDVLGDLYLAGCRIQGRVTANRSGHSLNAALVRRLRESESTLAAGDRKSGRMGA